MTLGNFVKGLEILRKHYKDPDGYHLGAEHDTIYIYVTDTPLSKEEANELILLGFWQPDTVEKYNPEDGWAIFI